MKRIFLFIIIVFPFLLFAQKNQAEQFLNKVQSTYDQYQSFESDFEITISFAEETPVVQKGKAYQTGNKFRLEMPGQLILSDGQAVWTYTEADNRVNITNLEQAAGMSSLSPALILKEVLMQDNKFRMEDIKTDQGQKMKMIEIAPNDRDSEFFKYQIVVSPASMRIQSIQTFSKDGSQYQLTLKTFHPDIQLKDALFRFDAKKYPKVTIEDLRL